MSEELSKQTEEAPVWWPWIVAGIVVYCLVDLMMWQLWKHRHAAPCCED